MVGSVENGGGGLKNEKPMSSDQHLYTGVFVCVCVWGREEDLIHSNSLSRR